MKKFLILLLLVTFACAEEEPLPTIIEGTIIWDDGTPASQIEIWLSGVDSGSIANPNVGPVLEKVLFRIEDSNRFYLELPANAGIDFCIVSFIKLLPNEVLEAFGDPSEFMCGDNPCDRVVPGKHYFWEIVLPKD